MMRSLRNDCREAARLLSVRPERLNGTNVPFLPVEIPSWIIETAR